MISTCSSTGNQSRVYLGVETLCAEAGTALVGASFAGGVALLALPTALGEGAALASLAAFAVALSADAAAEAVAAASDLRASELAMGLLAVDLSSLLGAPAGARVRNASVPATALPASAATPKPTQSNRLGRGELLLRVLLRSNPVPGAVRATMVSAAGPAGASGTKRVTVPVESGPSGTPG